MSLKENDIYFENLQENICQTMRLMENAKDNLFNANHRNLMLQKYGYTEAMRVTVEDLCQS